MHPGRYLSWATGKRSKRPLRMWSPFICQEYVAQVKPRVRLILVRARVFACVIRSTLMYFASGWRIAKPLRKSARMQEFSRVWSTCFLASGFGLSWSILKEFGRFTCVLLTCLHPRVMFHKSSQWQATSAILVRLNTSWQIFELGHWQALQAPFANVVPFHLPRICCTSQAPCSLDFSAGSGLCLCYKKYFDVLCLWLAYCKATKKICKNARVQSCLIHLFFGQRFWSILILKEFGRFTCVLLTCLHPRVMFHKSSQWQATSAILVRLNTSWQIFELGHWQALQAPFANVVPFHLPRICCTSQTPCSLDFSAGSGLCLCYKKYFDVLCLWLA